MSNGDAWANRWNAINIKGTTFDSGRDQLGYRNQKGYRKPKALTETNHNRKGHRNEQKRVRFKKILKRPLNNARCGDHLTP